MDCSSVIKWRSLCFFRVVFLIWVLGFPLKAVVSVSSDKSVLLQFKDSVSDPSGLLSWKSSNSDHCSWLGVTCDSGSRFCLSTFRVAAVENCTGGNVKLIGTLSPVIAKLTELRALSLPYNEFGGQIPIEIWGMESWRLRGDTQLLSNLMSLEILNLAGNMVNGTIPGFIGSFKELRGVYLSFNRLGGSIPSEIGSNCQKLEDLDLSGNLLVGGIPSSLGNCSQLRSILLFSNLLEEVIPAELGQLRNLEVLDVSRNSLSGSIPPALGNCSQLSALVLSNLFDPLLNIKNMKGDSNSGQLVSGNDDYNYFQGTIPVEITTLPKLRIIWAPRATLEGRFPSNWGACDSLEVINLSQNFFTGEIPEGFSRCKKLHFLDLSSNKLTGELVEKLPVPCMTVFDVSCNLLSGRIPRFYYGSCTRVPSNNRYVLESSSLSSAYVSFCKQRNLLWIESVVVNVSNNRISGQLPTEIGALCKTLTLLDASGNQINGSIPHSIGNLVSLVALNLSSNHLQGEIPSSLGKIEGLKYLSLAGNILTGPIPSSLGNLQSLEVLELSSNSLSGEIPRDLVNLRSLTVLLLNDNKLSGQIPSGLANVTTLSAFNVSFNNLSGPLPLNDNLMKCSSVLEILFGLAAYSIHNICISNCFSSSSSCCPLHLHEKMQPKVQNSEICQRVTVFNDIGVPLTFENVVRATGSFNASNCIGNGGFGATYKAEISPGVLVAIKRLAVGRFQGVQQFHAEVKTLGRLDHPNLVTLIGYHASETEMFLIYNYLPGGNLEKFIQERSTRAVDWRVLHKIALDIARALAYLHDQCPTGVLHCGFMGCRSHDDLVEVLHLAVVCTVDSLSTRPTMRQVVRRLKQLQPHHVSHFDEALLINLVM
ncbi:hypothetical protein AAG906_013353 [Vitis piasezkii]